MGAAGRYDRWVEMRVGAKGQSRKLKAESSKLKARSNRCIKAVIRLSALSFLLCAFLSSCHFNPNIQGKGSAALQGEWFQENVPYKNKLLQYTQYRFTFTCDSFYAVMQTAAKINQYPASCFHSGHWSEYAKGVYRQKKDSLFVFATFTHENYHQKLTGCYRIGQYLPVFIIRKKIADTLYLQNVTEQLPLILTLKRKITCTPQPL